MSMLLLPKVQEPPKSAETSLEMPGRGLHPGKLTAMLRSKFGIGEYEIMVCTS